MRNWIPSRVWIAGSVALAVLAGPGPAGERAESLDRELLRQAPKVIAHLKQKGYHHVGVLKFLARKGRDADAVYRDTVGTLNLKVANRLEVALLLAMDEKIAQDVRILRHASNVAAQIPRASSLTPEGRQALFGFGKYPLAWGGKAVPADAFLTGFIDIDPYLKDMTVHIVTIDRDSQGALPDMGRRVVSPITVAMNTALLVESGESYSLRGLFDTGRVELTQPEREAKAVEKAALAKLGKDPIDLAREPVKLEIFYDGVPQPLGPVKDGRAAVAEPQGKTVTFRLIRNDPSAARYGVVLLVNGENSLFRERLDPLRCKKWILGPDTKAVEVAGYQTDLDTVQEFRVASPAESKDLAPNFGKDVGTFTFIVFREPPKGEKLPAAGEFPNDLPEEIKEAAISRGLVPDEPFQTWEELQTALRIAERNLLSDNGRGLVTAGEVRAGKVEVVPFKPDSTPVTAVTIAYYKP